GVVAGTLSISGDHTTMTITPGSPLSANASYTVSVSGVADVSGNAAPAFTSGFTTGTASLTGNPSVVSVNPANGATNVAPGSSVVVTFNAPVDGSTVNSGTMEVFIGGSFPARGSYTVNGAVVTFTPSQPLPGNTFMVVDVFNITDVAGNVMNFFQSTYTTAAAADTTAPSVVSVTPQDGAAGIGLNSAVVLTFSKPLNFNTVYRSTFELLANGVQMQPGISLSADRQTVVLNQFTLPASSVVTVIATRDVTDLAGNHLADFRSSFSTGGGFDTAHAFVASQRPGSGSSGVGVNSTIVLYLSEPMNVGTVAGALHVVQNGVVVSGTVQVRDSGQTVEFVPGGPWQNNALVEVNLDSTALDADGVSLSNYQGMFRTIADPHTQRATFLSSTPLPNAVGVPLNAVLEIGYSKAIDPSSIVSNVRSGVDLFLSNNGQVVPATITLINGGQVIRYVPNGPLSANTGYCIDVNGVRDVDGVG